MDEQTGTCETPTTPPAACVPSPANHFCSDVEGNNQHRPPTVVEGERTVRTPSVSPTGAAVLPFTGAAALTWLLTSGGLLLALGGALVAVAGRRRRTT